MTKNRLNTVALILISMLAVACGDAGNEDGGFKGEGGTAGVDGGEGGQGGEAGQGGEGGEPDPDPVPFCGDGFVDADEQCDDGNEEDGDGCSSVCEEEVIGPIETEGQIAIHIAIDDLNSNEAPLEDDCPGTISLLIDNGEITGEGTCSLVQNANFLSYALDAEVDSDGALEGEVEITLNGKAHFVLIEGSFNDGVLAVEFNGVTLVVGAIRAIWSGEIDANVN